mmetsp:Transcript_78631/g.138641  ORF Transcript_78631/g.138641 Transcript_78631/m.138641 type:complete len:201 (-) Transcript_78631:2488-3090(-)
MRKGCLKRTSVLAAIPNLGPANPVFSLLGADRTSTRALQRSSISGTVTSALCPPTAVRICLAAMVLFLIWAASVSSLCSKTHALISLAVPCWHNLGQMALGPPSAPEPVLLDMMPVPIGSICEAPATKTSRARSSPRCALMDVMRRAILSGTVNNAASRISSDLTGSVRGGPTCLKRKKGRNSEPEPGIDKDSPGSKVFP